jgi:hypothetical protein
MYEEIFREVRQLTEDEYGNYVISHLLENGSEEDKVFIIDEILMIYVHFRCTKAALMLLKNA